MAPTNAQKIQQAGRAGDQSRLPAFDRRNTGSNTFLTATYALARRTAPEVVEPSTLSEQVLARMSMSDLRAYLETNEDIVKSNPAVAKRLLSKLSVADEQVQHAVRASNRRLREVLRSSEDKQIDMLRSQLADADNKHHAYVQEAVRTKEKLEKQLQARDKDLELQGNNIEELKIGKYLARRRYQARIQFFRICRTKQFRGNERVRKGLKAQLQQERNDLAAATEDRDRKQKALEEANGKLQGKLTAEKTLVHDLTEEKKKSKGLASDARDRGIRLRAMEKLRDEAVEAYQKMTAGRLATAERDVQAKTTANTKLEQRLQTANQQVVDLEKKKKELEAEVANLIRSKTALETKSTEDKKTIQKHEASIEKSAKELETKTSALADKTREFDIKAGELGNKTRELEQKSGEWAKSLRGISYQKSFVEEDRDRLREEVEEERKKVQGKDTQLTNLGIVAMEMAQKIQRLRTKVGSMDTDLSQEKQQTQAAASRIAQLAQDLQNAQQKCQQLTNDIATEQQRTQEATSEGERIAEELQNKQQKCQQLTNDIATEQQRTHEATSEGERIAEELQNEQQKCQQLTNEMATEQQRTHEATSEGQRIAEELQNEQQKCQQLTNEMATEQQRTQEATSEGQRNAEELEKEQRKCQQLTNDLGTEQQRAQEATSKGESLAEDLQNEKEKYERLTTNLTAEQEKVREATKEITQKGRDLEEMEAQRNAKDVDLKEASRKLGGAVDNVQALATTLWSTVQTGKLKMKSVYGHVIEERRRWQAAMKSKDEAFAKLQRKNDKRRELLRAALPLVEEVRAREVGPLPLR